MDAKKNTNIEEQPTQAIGPDTTGIDMSGGEPIDETAALPPELLTELGETKTIPMADIIEHGGRWDPYKGESIPDESAPAPKRKRTAIIAAVAAVAALVAIGVGVAVASPAPGNDSQPSTSSAATSSSSSSAAKASKSSSSASEKAGEAKEEQQAAEEEQDQGASQDTGQVAAYDGGSANQGGNSAGTSEPQKRWVDEVGHYEQQLVQAAYDEPVYETQVRTICNRCGADVTGDPASHLRMHASKDEYASCGDVSTTVQVDTIHHGAVYESVYVVDTPGHWE